MDPADADAIIGELFLEQFLVLEDQADRVVIGPVDGDLLEVRCMGVMTTDGGQQGSGT